MTFTLLAADPATGLLAAASASRSLAVGNAVIAVDPAVGVVASQAWTNRELRALMLDALAEGRSPAEVVAQVPVWDVGADLRQVAAMTLSGDGDTRTGSDTTAWAGARVRPGLVVLGNLLTGAEVLDAVVDRYDTVEDATPADGAAGGDGATAAGSPFADVALLARRVIAAMLAGEDAGGDRRGRQSAAVVVTRRRQHRAFPPALDLDLRVDDDPDPLQRLARLVEMQVQAHTDGRPGADGVSVRTG